MLCFGGDILNITGIFQFLVFFFFFFKYLQHYKLGRLYLDGIWHIALFGYLTCWPRKAKMRKAQSASEGSLNLMERRADVMLHVTLHFVQTE